MFGFKFGDMALFLCPYRHTEKVLFKHTSTNIVTLVYGFSMNVIHRCEKRENESPEEGQFSVRAVKNSQHRDIGGPESPLTTNTGQ